MDQIQILTTIQPRARGILLTQQIQIRIQATNAITYLFTIQTTVLTKLISPQWPQLIVPQAKTVQQVQSAHHSVNALLETAADTSCITIMDGYGPNDTSQYAS